jgi:hypothetical protein
MHGWLNVANVQLQQHAAWAADSHIRDSCVPFAQNTEGEPVAPEVTGFLHNPTNTRNHLTVRRCTSSSFPRSICTLLYAFIPNLT